MDLVIHVLGKFVKGLVVSGTEKRTRLLSATLCHNVLAFLGQLAELGDS